MRPETFASFQKLIGYGIRYDIQRRQPPKDQAQGPPSRQGPLGRILPHRHRPRPVLRRQRALPAGRPDRRSPLGATARHPRQVPLDRPRQLRPGVPGRSPRTGPCQPQDRTRGRRPAGRQAPRSGHADVRRGGQPSDRDPPGGMEEVGQDIGVLGDDAARLCPPALGRQRCRPGDDRRRDGRAAAHLVAQARNGAEGSPAHRQRHEVGHRPRLPERQPGRRRHHGGAAAPFRSRAAHAGAPPRGGRRRDCRRPRLAGVGGDTVGLRISGADRGALR